MSAFRQKCIAFCIPRISERIRGYFTATRYINSLINYLLTYILLQIASFQLGTVSLAHGW